MMLENFFEGGPMAQSIDSLGIDPAEDARRTGENISELVAWPGMEVKEGGAQLSDDLGEFIDEARRDADTLPEQMLLFWLHLY